MIVIFLILISIVAKVIAPSIDVAISKVCQELLDDHFPSLSSRWLTGFTKDCLISFMKMQSMIFPHNDDESSDVKQLFFLLLPIVVVLYYGKEDREPFDEIPSKSILITKGIIIVTVIISVVIIIIYCRNGRFISSHTNNESTKSNSRI